MSEHPSLEEIEAAARPWPLFGYAPGDYICRCARCDVEFDGDKRAVHCLSCAASQASIALDRLRALEEGLREWKVSRHFIPLWLCAAGVWMAGAGVFYGGLGMFEHHEYFGGILIGLGSGACLGQAFASHIHRTRGRP